MPYLHIKVGKPITAQQRKAIGDGCAHLISLLPEKNADNCMIQIEDQCDFYMKGQKNPCVFVELRLYGPSPDDKKSAFTSALCELLCTQIGTQPQLMYMNILELPHWVVGGNLK